MVDKGED